MTDTSTASVPKKTWMAARAACLNFPSGREAFMAAMEEAGFKVIQLRLGETDVLIFSDASAMFADTAHGTRPWTVWPHEGDSVDFDDIVAPPPDTPGRLIQTLDMHAATKGMVRPDDLGPEDRSLLDVYLQHLAWTHPDGPEVLRPFLVTAHRPLEWTSGTTRDQAVEMLSMAALLICPQARRLSIFSRSLPGRTHVQLRRDAKMVELFAAHNSRVADASMAAHFSGRAYAEIDDVESASALDVTRTANARFVPLSMRILERMGMPEGWETAYNDGAVDRLSGHSADPHAEQIILDPISQHGRLNFRARLEDALRNAGLDDALALLDTPD